MIKINKSCFDLKRVLAEIVVTPLIYKTVKSSEIKALCDSQSIFTRKIS